MPGIKAITTAALLGLASAAPAPQLKTRRDDASSFKMTNQPTGNYVQLDGIAALAKAYSKHNIAVPDGYVLQPSPPTTNGNSASGAAVPAPQAQSKAAGGQTPGQSTAGGQTGTVAAMSQRNDVEYTSVISIGGQQISMDFDTGSSDLWVLNTGMTPDQTKGHTLFDPKKSQNFKVIPGASYAVAYGDSSTSQGSTVGTDVVNIGGAEVPNQVVELADKVGPSFIADTSSNGLVGLAFGKINRVQPQPANTFFENAKNLLAQPVFTANLKHAATGAYEFGKVDTTQFTGQMTWTPIDTSSGFWQFTTNKFSVGSSQTFVNQAAKPAIADTGTSLMLMDPPVVQTYYSAVAGAGLDQTSGAFVFPNNAKLPDFKFSVGNNQNLLTVPGNMLVYTSFNQTHQFGGLQSNQGSPVQILGDVMFKAQFVAFDFGQNRLGFAPHAN